MIGWTTCRLSRSCSLTDSAINNKIIHLEYSMDAGQSTVMPKSQLRKMILTVVR